MQLFNSRYRATKGNFPFICVITILQASGEIFRVLIVNLKAAATRRSKEFGSEADKKMRVATIKLRGNLNYIQHSRKEGFGGWYARLALRIL